MINIERDKYQRYKIKLQQRKKVAVTVIVIGATAITLNLFGVFDYLEAKSGDLVSFKEEIKYEDTNGYVEYNVCLINLS